MYSKIKGINPDNHHFDLVNQVILISLLESDHVNVNHLSENAFIPCHSVNSALFIALKVEIEGGKLVAISHHIIPSILRDLISSFLNEKVYRAVWADLLEIEE